MAADATKEETIALEKAVAAIQKLQTWTVKYTEAGKALAKTLGEVSHEVDAAVQAQRQLASFPLDLAKKRWEALTVPSQVRKSWQEFREEQAKFKLNTAKADWAAYTLPQRVKQDWKEFREEQAKFQRMNGPRGGFYRAAEKYGGSPGRAIADRGLGGAAIGGITGLAVAGVLKAAAIAADQAQHSLSNLAVTHERITAGSLAAKTGEFARAYGNNAIAAVKWNVEAEALNKTTASFATTMGMSVSKAQEFTEFLARSSRVMGVDFADAAELATEQMLHFGKTEGDMRVLLGTVQRVSKESGQALGGMGAVGGKVGGIFAKDLLKALTDVSKETDLFRHRSETLIQVMGQLFLGATKLGVGYGEAAKAAKGAFKVIGSLTETEAFFSGGGAKRRLMNKKTTAAENKRLEELESKGGLTAEEDAEAKRLRRRKALRHHVKTLGIFGNEGALNAELEESSPEAIVDVARDYKRQYGVQGYKKQMLERAGVKVGSREAVALDQALLQLAEKGTAAFKDLSDEQKKLVEKASHTETKEERAMGQYSVIVQPLKGIEAGINKLLGATVSLLSKAVGWLAKLGGGNRKEEETAARAEALSSYSDQRKKDEERRAKIPESEKTKAIRALPTAPNVEDLALTPEQRRKKRIEEAADTAAKKDIEDYERKHAPKAPRGRKGKGGKETPATPGVLDFMGPGAKPPVLGAFLQPQGPAGAPGTATASIVPPVKSPEATLAKTSVERAADTQVEGGGRGAGAKGGARGGASATASSMRYNQDGSTTMKLEVNVPGFAESVGEAIATISATSAGPKVKGA